MKLGASRGGISKWENHVASMFVRLTVAVALALVALVILAFVLKIVLVAAVIAALIVGVILAVHAVRRTARGSNLMRP